MNYSVHVTRYRMFYDELSDVLDLVLTGEIIDDRATAERVVRALGVIVYLHEGHCIDPRGQCLICWTVPRRWWRPWLRRSTCSVYSALNFFLRQPAETIVSTIKDRQVKKSQWRTP